MTFEETHLTVIVGVTCDSWPRPVADAVPVVIRASMAVETPSREGRRCRALKWLRAPRPRPHDNRAAPRAKEKLA